MQVAFSQRVEIVLWLSLISITAEFKTHLRFSGCKSPFQCWFTTVLKAFLNFLQFWIRRTQLRGELIRFDIKFREQRRWAHGHWTRKQIACKENKTETKIDTISMQVLKSCFSTKRVLFWNVYWEPLNKSVTYMDSPIVGFRGWKLLSVLKKLIFSLPIFFCQC